jgi:hypothetical protein
MPASPKFIVVGKAFFHHFLRNLLWNLSKLRLIIESQTHVFHRDSSFNDPLSGLA